MRLGKRLLVFSSIDQKARELTRRAGEWQCLICVADSIHDFRGKIEGGSFDYVLAEDSSVLRHLIGEADPEGNVLKTPLAEIERRHIERVVNAADGNKTRAAKILKIDTKTLYNKLKSYAAADQLSPKSGVPSQRTNKIGWQN